VGHGDPHPHPHPHRPLMKRVRQSLHARVFSLFIPHPEEYRIAPALGHDLAWRPPVAAGPSAANRLNGGYRMDNMNPAVSSSSPSFSFFFTYIHSHPSLLLAIDRRPNDVRQGTSLPRDSQVPPPSPLSLSLSLSLSPSR